MARVTGFRRVALEVLIRADRDFKGTDIQVNWSAIAKLRQRIEAGAFLLEREDDVTRFWFDAAGYEITRVRERWAGAEHRNRYAILRKLRAEEQRYRLACATTHMLVATSASPAA